MLKLNASVGQKGVNARADVTLVQSLLGVHRRWLSPDPPPLPDGICTPSVIAAIRKFQETAGALAADAVDGLVSARGFTIKRLETPSIPKPSSRAFLDQCWARSQGQLTRADFETAAKALSCEVEAIMAVTVVETGIRGSWDDFGRPTILFERHKFSKFSGGKWNVTHPDIANGNPGGYGTFSSQYKKLYRAATLDQPAALKAASWGGFQILGENHVACGYATVEAFVDGMLTDELAHLNAFVGLLTKEPYHATTLKALQTLDWATFASRYNGPDYKKNAYDTKMANEYARLKPPKPKPK